MERQPNFLYLIQRAADEKRYAIEYVFALSYCLTYNDFRPRVATLLFLAAHPGLGAAQLVAR